MSTLPGQEVAAPPEALIGHTLGPYHINRIIGVGGMATVYEGENDQGVRCAIKVVNALAIARDPTLLERFRREAAISRQLKGDHVVDILDFAELPDGTPYLVMEFLDGEDLADRLLRVGRLEPSDAMKVLEEVGEALSTAHAKSVYHRDLKPANIFLAKTAAGAEVVKLLDFGISKVMGSTNANLTAQGLMVGTPWYMSPEQARGGQLDHRSDLFSLAIVIYEAMAGQLPFDALGESEILFKIVSDPPAPIRELVPSLPPEVEQVFEKALAKRASDRFQTVQEFVAAMSEGLAAGENRPLPKVIVSADVAANPKRPKSREAAVKSSRPSKPRRATSTRKTVTAEAKDLPEQPAGKRVTSEGVRQTGRRRTLTASVLQLPNEPLRPTAAPPDVRSVAPLFAARLIDDQAEQRARDFQRQWGGTLIDALLRMELVGEADLLRAFAQAENTRYVRSDKVAKAVPQPALLQTVPRALAERLHILPLSLLSDLGELRVVAAVPIEPNIPEELLPLTKAQCVAIFVATPAAVHASVSRWYGDQLNAFDALTPNGAGPHLGLSEGVPSASVRLTPLPMPVRVPAAPDAPAQRQPLVPKRTEPATVLFPGRAPSEGKAANGSESPRGPVTPNPFSFESIMNPGAAGAVPDRSQGPSAAAPVAPLHPEPAHSTPPGSGGSFQAHDPFARSLPSEPPPPRDDSGPGEWKPPGMAAPRPASIPAQPAAQPSSARPASMPIPAAVPSPKPASAPAMAAARPAAPAPVSREMPAAQPSVDGVALKAPAPASAASANETIDRALDAMAQTTFKLIADLLSADRMAMVLESGKRWVEPAALGSSDPIPAGVMRQVKGGSSSGVLISDASGDARFMNATGLAAGIRTALAVQIRHGDAIYGVLFAGNTGNRIFRATDMRLLEGLASQAAVLVMATRALGGG